MLAKNILAALALTVAPPALAMRAPSAPAGLDVGDENRAVQGAPHTITWYCVDLNDVYRVDVPVVVGRAVLNAPEDATIPTCSDTPFPVVVPAGSGWTVGDPYAWYMSISYPRDLLQALLEDGYTFVSMSPTEDLMQKIAEVRYVVDPTEESGFLDGGAVFSFEPRTVFRLVRMDQTLGALSPGPPDGAGPGIWFTGIAGPVSPGWHWVYVWWRLSDTHNDGGGLDEEHFLPEGWNLLAGWRFMGGS